jgi:hypothetical protein
VAWALSQFEGDKVRGEAHFPLLIHQVHDSLAGFYLIGYMTAEDKAEKLLAIVREGRARGVERLEPYQRQVYENYEAAKLKDSTLRAMVEDRLDAEKDVGKNATTRQEALRAEAGYHKSAVFSPVEQQRAWPLFPTQTDVYADTMPDGLENVARFITNTRREGGGYLLPRAIFGGNQR